MSVAIFSDDPVLARMLELEAKRCGLETDSYERATVWLIDLDRKPTLPRGDTSAMRIGFSRQELLQTPQGIDLLFPLPFSAEALERTLRQEMQSPACPTLRREGDALWLSGKKLHFSETEQKILTLLIRNRHRTVTLSELAEVLGESAEKSNAVAVYLYRLRHKLEADGVMRIRTLRGVGYQWMGEQA